MVFVWVFFMGRGHPLITLFLLVDGYLTTYHMRFQCAYLTQNSILIKYNTVILAHLSVD